MPRLEDLSDAWREELLSLEMEKLSESEKQSPSGEVLNNARAVWENYTIHSNMVEFECLLGFSRAISPEH